MISLIVPNLNEERYLINFFESLTRQTEKDFEVIIVDGGSTDRSLDICRVYSEVLNLKVIIDKTPNIGYVRNVGSESAEGTIFFNTSSDVMFNKDVIEKVKQQFNDLKLISLTARTKPVSSQIFCHFAYQGFDLLRWAFSKLPGRFRKYRPGGNFFVIRKWVFKKVEGFPELPINEDGALGQKIDAFLIKTNRYKVKFDLSLCVHHHVKRFEEKGSLKSLMFYLYVFANLFPMLKPLLYGIEAHSAEVFRNRSDLRDFSERK